MSDDSPSHDVKPGSQPQAPIRVRTYLICVVALVAVAFGGPALEKALRPQSERVCTTEDVVISHENRSRTSYRLYTSCGQLVVDDSIVEEAQKAIKAETTYRMVIASGILGDYLVEVPVEVTP